MSGFNAIERVEADFCGVVVAFIAWLIRNIVVAWL